MIPARTEEEKPNMNNPHDVLKYRQETVQKYSELPTDELQRIVNEYENRGKIMRLICDCTEKINSDIAREILAQRTFSK